MEMNKTITCTLCEKTIYEVFAVTLPVPCVMYIRFFQLKPMDLFDLKEHPSACLTSEPLSLGIGRSDLYLTEFWFICIIYISS